MLYDLESHAKDGRCGISRNEDIRRYVGKLVEKLTISGNTPERKNAVLFTFLFAP